MDHKTEVEKFYRADDLLEKRLKQLTDRGDLHVEDRIIRDELEERFAGRGKIFGMVLSVSEIGEISRVIERSEDWIAKMLYRKCSEYKGAHLEDAAYSMGCHEKELNEQENTVLSETAHIRYV